jgi:NADH:ubiquinone oxidoreductase subunit F (NADH-binding)
VAEASGPRYVVANGEEGEPGSWKDRYLMRRHPHLVIEGAAVAAVAVGAEETWIYLSDPVAAEVIDAALVAAGEALADAPSIRVAKVPHRYVAGEESAAVRFLSGGPALPTAKPPRPFERGVRDRPTLVNNVETLAHGAWILAHGAEEFRHLGTDSSPGTFLACVTGEVENPMLIEAPLGVPLRSLVAEAHPLGEPRHVLFGGYFSGILSADHLDVPVDFDNLHALGVGLGNGTFTVLCEACPVRVLGDLLAFFAAESSGQCLACAKGTVAMRDAISRFRDASAGEDDVAALARYGSSLRGRGACHLLDAAAMTATRSVEQFAGLLRQHMEQLCGKCAQSPRPDPSGGFALGTGSLERLLGEAQ